MPPLEGRPSLGVVWIAVWPATVRPQVSPAPSSDYVRQRRTIRPSLKPTMSQIVLGCPSVRTQHRTQEFSKNCAQRIFDVDPLAGRVTGNDARGVKNDPLPA